MPKTITKDILKPGIYFTHRGLLEITPKHVQEICDNANKQLSDGHNIPLTWDHPLDEMGLPAITDAEKQKLSDYPFYARGLVKAIRIEDGILKADFEMEDEKLAASLVKSKEARVSPQYGKLTVDGKEFSRALHHVCLTHNPVQKKQDLFIDKPTVSLSDIAPYDDGTDYIRLDSGEYLEGFEKNPETGVVRLAEMPDKKLTPTKDKSVKPSEKKTKKPTNKTKPGSDKFNNPEDEPNDGSMMGDDEEDSEDTSGDPNDPNNLHETQPNDLPVSAFSLAEEEKALQGFGLHISDTSLLKGKPQILQALLSTLAESISDLQFQAPVKTIIPMADTTQTPTAPEVITREEFVALSNKFTEAQSVISLSENTIRVLVSEVEKSRQAGYTRRIDECVRTGRCDADKGSKLKALASAYKFSMTEGESELDIRLSEIESLPPESVVKLSNDTNRFQQAHETSPVTSSEPSPFSGTMTPEQIEEYLTNVLRVGPATQTFGFQN